MNPICAQVIDLAKRQLGYKESGVNQTKYSRFFDVEAWQWFNTKKQGAEWCAIFICWLFAQDETLGQKQALSFLGCPAPKNNCAAGVPYLFDYLTKKGNIYYNVIVVLVTGKNQSRRMARVMQKLLSENGITHVFRQTELTVGYVNTAYVLKVYCRLRRIHFIVTHRNAEIEVGNGEHKSTEFSFAGRSFRRCNDSVRSSCSVVLLGCIPIRKNAGVAESERSI